MFNEAYVKLNPAQRAAVDAIDGPVMVVAGPGTGKTQILALRIANILQKTDTPADGILCLTFTNSGVRAMQERLRTYIGPTASRVVISTFHSFGMKLIEEFHTYLNFETAPKLIDDLQSVALADEILHAYEWKYIRSRANPALYFNDIKSLISLLKRERITPESFQVEIDQEIESIKNDPENISSRGPTKGNLKSESLKKIESLERTRETVTFYTYYESLKRDRGFLDYDDVLENLVALVEVSDDVRDTIRERYLYVLVDEHQDSSGVQNDFLSRVWGDTEQPNIFVVGDDRQLIYGFGGASLEHFEKFKTAFGKIQLIKLVDNYRSTQVILDSAEALLQSSLSDGKLIGHRLGDTPIQLVECDYPRDEIIACGLEIKEKIVGGLDPNECAVLVPKNSQVKNAVRVLADLGIPVASAGVLKLFELPETRSFLTILSVMTNPYNAASLGQTLLDPLSGIPAMVAYEYLVSIQTRKLSLEKLLQSEQPQILSWATRLKNWLDACSHSDVYALIQKIGDELFIQTATNHDDLTRRVEIVRTLLHLTLSQTEKLKSGEQLQLTSFLEFIDRLQEYGTDIALAVFAADQGVKVMTLHASKGLEFEYVWIAHLDEKNLMGKRSGGFTLPESLSAKVEQKDELVLKRQLYVAITRAKQFCTLSYARHGYTGGDQMLANVILDLPQELFNKKTLQDSESFIRESNISAYVTSTETEQKNITLQDLGDLVSSEYASKNISVSALNNFFDCPWKWYFRNLLQLPEPETMSLQFGNVIHTTIEKILKQKLRPNQEDLHALIKSSVEDLHIMDGRDEARIEQDAVQILMNWVSARLPNLQADYQSEVPFYGYKDMQWPHLKITGKIDLLETLDDVTVRVTDFKTGKPKTKSEIEKPDAEDRMSDYLRQLAMYSFLLEGKTGGNTDVVESRLEFVESLPGDKSAMYATKITGDHIEKLRQDITDFDTALKNGTWINRPCHHKSYGKSDDGCPYCKLAEIYQK